MNSKSFKKKGPKSSGSRSSLMMIFLKWIGLMMVWSFLLFLGVVLWFGYDLPNCDDIAKLPRQPHIIVLDQKGRMIANYGDFYGKPVQAEKLSPHVIKVLLATEDRRFFSHFGIDVVGIFRAFTENFRAGRIVQGGSTLTQQLAKNFLQTKKCFGVYDKSLKRKISEALLSLLLEWRFTKMQILTMYLNRVFWGSRNYGLDAASLRYFGKHAEELNLAEAAVLVGMLKGPSRFNPISNPEDAQKRATQVLQGAVESGFISQEDMNEALKNPPVLDSGAKNNSGRYFADWIVDHVQDFVDVDNQDLIVTTTLDLSLQKCAEYQMRYIMDVRGVHWKMGNMALLAMKPNGAIVAMVGGVSYRQSSFNRVTQALRQPGSSFKYFIYLTALENGYTPDSRIADTVVSLNGWTPSNFMYKSTTGETTLREGLVNSVNAIAVRLSVALGVSRIKEMSRRLGVNRDLPHNHTLALGTGLVSLLDMTGAFAVLANNGWRVEPHGILSIRNKKGEVLYERSTKLLDKEPLLSEEVVDDMQDMMEAVVNRGTGRRAAIPGVRICGKTGTTNNDRDTWFIGMTPNLVVGVWGGCDNDKPMVYHSGGSPATHLWKAFVLKVLAYRKNPQIPEEELLKNDGIVPWGKEDVPVVPVKKENLEEEEDEDDEDDEETEETVQKSGGPQQQKPQSSTPPKDVRQDLIENILSSMNEGHE